MLSDKYTKGMLYQEFIRKVMQSTATKIMAEQKDRVYTYYNYRTGHIGSELDKQTIRISSSGSSTSLDMGFIIDLRFLDLKTTRYGRKKIYGPVYNKPLWGYVYGYMYGTLRYGLTSTVQREILDVIRDSYKTPLAQ